MIARIDGLIRKNIRITEEQIRVHIGFSHGSVYAIIKYHLQFRKILALWLPHQLTEGQTIDRMSACLIICSGSSWKSMRFCHILPQGTKHGATILSPRANGKANNGNLNSTPPKKSKTAHTSTSKVMMTFFFDCRGPLLGDFLERRATISAKRYAETL